MSFISPRDSGIIFFIVFTKFFHSNSISHVRPGRRGGGRQSFSLTVYTFRFISIKPAFVIRRPVTREKCPLDNWTRDRTWNYFRSANFYVNPIKLSRDWFEYTIAIPRSLLYNRAHPPPPLPPLRYIYNLDDSGVLLLSDAGS